LTGKIGTQMNSIEKVKVKKIKCCCAKCYNYLKTNPLCRLGRDTTKIKYCKWYYVSNKNASPQQNNPKVKTMQEVIDSINKLIEERKIKQQKKYDERFNK